MLSVTGHVNKAFLILHREKVNQKTNTDKIAATTSAIINAHNVQPNATIDSLKSSLTAAQLDVQIMVVQYNPSSINITSNSQPISFSYLQKHVDENVPNQNIRPPQVTFSTDLIFDAMNVNDSFLGDRFTVSPSRMLTGALPGKETIGNYTVQPHTNAIIAALMSAKTRTITFRWGNMSFTGQLTEVQAEYDMFSTAGKPVRSKVRINITQQMTSTADISYWNKVFDYTFGVESANEGSSNSARTTSQSATNLINLNSF